MTRGSTTPTVVRFPSAYGVTGSATLAISAHERRQRGSALVEFAFVVVVLLTIMFGIIDFSRALYAYSFVSDAARQAGRFAIVRGSACTGLSGGCPLKPDGSEVNTYVQGLAPAGLYVDSSATAGTPGYLKATTTWTGTTGDGATPCAPINNRGCVVEVQVQYTYGFSLPYLKSLSSVNMLSTSQMVISQ